MIETNRRFEKTPFPASSRWWVFLASFFILMFIFLLCALIVPQAVDSERGRLLISSCLQNIIAFALPVWITWNLTSKHPAEDMRVSRKPTLKSMLGVIIIYALAFPALNQIIYWNSIVSFPDSMKGIEETFRRWEEAGIKSTSVILDVKSVWGMLVNILFIGIITGFGEECLFRGGLLRMIRESGSGKTFAIWSAAFIFSAIHFQFYGFIPRMLLGAWFGYLLVWSGSLWTAVFAHALNNSIVVFFAWLSKYHYPNFNSEELGVVTSGIPWPFIASVAMIVAFLLYFKKFFFSTVNKASDGNHYIS